jgi:hypothetical protein
MQSRRTWGLSLVIYLPSVPRRVLLIYWRGGSELGKGGWQYGYIQKKMRKVYLIGSFAVSLEFLPCNQLGIEHRRSLTLPFRVCNGGRDAPTANPKYYNEYNTQNIGHMVLCQFGGLSVSKGSCPLLLCCHRSQVSRFPTDQSTFMGIPLGGLQA